MPQNGPDNNKLILIGEDDLDDQEFLKEVFSSIDNSFTLLFSTSGAEILTHLNKSNDTDLPRLIILDYNMPGLNGVEILMELRNNKRYDGIPKIIWSTSGSSTYRNMCLAVGAHDYLVKPSNVNDLVEICRYMLTTCVS
ncbi:MAG TPA: response regulator [Chitinophagaceae bacterium]|nr:response regulator [Chitinophagaceae bacterium]